MNEEYKVTPRKLAICKPYIKLNQDSIDLFESLGTIINDDTEYLFLPFWLEKIDEDEYILHRLGNLPNKLKKLIKEFRLDNEV